MGNIGQVQYEAGVVNFQLGRYEEAISNWIKAYEIGYGKENILENIYNCFITPNEGEFRKNYAQGRVGFTELPFEECVLDFIPLCEGKFCIFDRAEKVFWGTLTLEQEPVCGEKASFHNILYTDTWDIREMLPDMRENRRDTVYILLEGMEQRFASFFKLPGFSRLYLWNAVIFRDVTLMRTFFEEYEESYLPKQLITTEVEKYSRIIREIHEKRIHHVGAERRNIFLSICIPSYNRGELALANVKHLLSSPYDSEIEIIVSNNGSAKENGYYNKIKNIGDARVRYHEFAENMGYAANVLKVCSMAKGNYAVLVSDEDWMILENLEKYLSFIKSCPNVGFFVSGTKGHMQFEQNTIRKAGIESIENVSTWSYLTGFTFNVNFLHTIRAFEELENLRLKRSGGINWKNEVEMQDRVEKRNLFVELLTHVCVALMLCRYYDMIEIGMDLWDAKVNCAEQEEAFGPYYKPESRMEMQNSLMELCYHVLNMEQKDFTKLFLFQCRRTHFLIRLSTKVFPDEMMKINSEWEIHAWIYKEQIKYLNAFPVSLTEEELHWIQREISKVD